MAQRRQVDATSQKDQLALTVAGIVLVVLAVGGGWTSMHLGYALDGWPAPPNNPAELAAAIAKGSTPWTSSATHVAIGLAAVLVVLFILVLLVIARSGRKTMRPDRAARHMAGGRDVAHLNAKGSRAKATRLGTESASPGVPLGKTVRGRSTLFSSWEDMIVIIAGPRTNKPPPTRSPTCCPPRAPRWRPRTNATSSTPPATSAAASVRPGSSTHNASPTSPPPGGGTR